MLPIKRDDGTVYIEGVRKISWDTGEMCEFASALVSALSCLGEQIPYSYVMGTSGVAFRFTLNPGAWDFENYGIRNISPDRSEPVHRALEAAGYEYTEREKTFRPENAAEIVASIDRGVPVLAYGVVGPSDCCILCGYDQGGEVLLGWSTFQNIPDDHDIPHDVTGYFRKPGWHDRLGGYILIGAQKERRPERAIYLDALRWAVHLLCMPKMGARHTGLEGLSVWAEEMTREAYFPQGDEQVLGQRYVSTAINMTMLRDHCSAEPFLNLVMAAVPDFQPELSRAAGCYSQVRSLRSGMDDLIHDNFSPKAMRAIADPAIRREYAQTILQIRDWEQEAATYMGRLVRRCG